MSIQPFPVFEPQPEPEPVEAQNRLTERDMLDALHARYALSLIHISEPTRPY